MNVRRKIPIFSYFRVFFLGSFDGHSTPCSEKKHPEQHRLSLEEGLTNFNNFFAGIFLAQLTIK